MNRRIAACSYHPDLERFEELLDQSLVSEDDSEHESHPTKPRLRRLPHPRYIVRSLKWRSPALTALMKLLDDVSLIMRYNSGRASRGQYARQRIRLQTKQAQFEGDTPTFLPQDFYDETAVGHRLQRLQPVDGIGLRIRRALLE